MRAEQVQLGVRTPAGAFPGAVEPPFVPAHTITNVTFDIPLTDDWSIWADGVPVIVNAGVSSEILQPGCSLWIVLLDLGSSDGCDG